MSVTALLCALRGVKLTREERKPKVCHLSDDFYIYLTFC